MIRTTALTLLLLPLAAFAQTQREAIHVNGVGEVSAEPDIARFTFGIEGQTDDPQNAKQRADSIAGTLVEELEALGIASEDIRSTPVTLYPYTDNQTQRELVRFNRTTTVTLRDLDEFERVERVALEAGVNSVEGVEFDVSNERELMDRARDLALDDARAQADAALEHVGAELGRVLSIELSRSSGGPPRPFARSLEASAAQDPNFRTGLIEIRTEVSVTYEIVQR